MENKLFRKSSLDKVSSPDQLNEYIRVANPAVWLILGAVALLLAGALVWGFVGRLDTTVSAVADVRDGKAAVYIEKSNSHKPEAGMRFTVGGHEYALDAVDDLPVMLSTTARYSALLEVWSKTPQTVYVASAGVDLPDGVYETAVVINSASPLSFIFN